METLAQMLEDYRNGERGLPSYEELVALSSSPAIADDVPNDPIECVGYLAGMAFGNCPAEEIGHCVSIITVAIAAKEQSC